MKMTKIDIQRKIIFLKTEVERNSSSISNREELLVSKFILLGKYKSLLKCQNTKQEIKDYTRRIEELEEEIEKTEKSIKRKREYVLECHMGISELETDLEINH